MKHTLEFKINCGETTCAYKYACFCPYFETYMNGQASCFFYGKLYEDDTGWTQRHPECIKSTEKGKETYEKGYEDGYKDGLEDGYFSSYNKQGLEDGYFSSYNKQIYDGLEDGYYNKQIHNRRLKDA